MGEDGDLSNNVFVYSALVGLCVCNVLVQEVRHPSQQSLLLS